MVYVLDPATGEWTSTTLAESPVPEPNFIQIRENNMKALSKMGVPDKLVRAMQRPNTLLEVWSIEGVAPAAASTGPGGDRAGDRAEAPPPSGGASDARPDGGRDDGTAPSIGSLGSVGSIDRGSRSARGALPGPRGAGRRSGRALGPRPRGRPREPLGPRGGGLCRSRGNFEPPLDGGWRLTSFE